MNLRDIIIAPVITEKSMQDAKLSRFTFKVSKDANKTIIKKAVEEMFKVKVLKTYISVVKGKSRKSGMKRQEVTITSWKKATVKLPKDQKIAMFDVGGQKS